MKKTKTFKEYYQDPKFKKKHKKYMKTKVKCKCSVYVNRYNLSHHHKTKKCQKLILEKSQIIKKKKYKNIKNKIKELEIQLNDLKTQLQ